METFGPRCARDYNAPGLPGGIVTFRAKKCRSSIIFLSPHPLRRLRRRSGWGERKFLGPVFVSEEPNDPPGKPVGFNAGGKGSIWGPFL